MSTENNAGKPVIGVIPGDAAGVGPELIAKILADGFLENECRALIIGDKRVLDRAMKTIGAECSVAVVDNAEDADFSQGVQMLDTADMDPADVVMGEINIQSGKSAGDAMIRALELYKKGLIDGFVFAPLNKTALKKGGHDFESEHRMFKHYLGLDEDSPSGEINMLGNLMTSRVTSHIPLSDVARNLTLDSILWAIRLINDASKKSGVPNPRVAVAALNPHAGEHGTCGREEIDVISPAIDAAKAEGINASGPYPSDILFIKAFNGDFDAAVTMYHDQGQIALKLKGFDYGITVAGGIPIPVATAAHGTAYDIAGKNIAKPEAMKNAVRMVVTMAKTAKR